MVQNEQSEERKKEKEKERRNKCFTRKVSLLFFLITQTSVNSTFFSAVI